MHKPFGKNSCHAYCTRLIFMISFVGSIRGFICRADDFNLAELFMLICLFST